MPCMKLEYKKIEKIQSLQTSFTKRRQGLFKKTKELCQKTGAEAFLVVYSMAGNLYTWTNREDEQAINHHVKRPKLEQVAKPLRIDEPKRDQVVETCDQVAQPLRIERRSGELRDRLTGELKDGKVEDEKVERELIPILLAEKVEEFLLRERLFEEDKDVAEADEYMKEIKEWLDVIEKKRKEKLMIRGRELKITDNINTQQTLTRQKSAESEEPTEGKELKVALAQSTFAAESN